jgi:Uncharacterised nucleotidyltransferase
MKSQADWVFTPAREAAMLSMRVDVLTAEVATALRVADVRCLLLKGPSIARWIYESPALRPYADCDLLVAPDAIGRAEAVIAGLGFELRLSDVDTPGWEQASHEWARGSDPEVDLHRTIVGIGVSPRDLWAMLTSQTETIVVAGADLEMLSRPARAMHLALHAAHHGIRWSRVQRDLLQALEVLDPSTWAAAADLSHRLDAVGAFSTGLRLTQPGARLAAELGLSRKTSLETALLATSPPPGAMGWQHLAATPGVVGRIKLLAQKLLPTPRFMRHWSTVAGRGRSGLLIAYLWRPFWLTFQCARGFRAWLRARRSVRDASA